MTGRAPPQRHWRSYGNDPLPTGAEALLEPFAAFPGAARGVKGGREFVPIQSFEYWEEKARLAEETAKAMRHAPTKAAMLEIAQLYRQLAERTRKLEKLAGTGEKKQRD